MDNGDMPKHAPVYLVRETVMNLFSRRKQQRETKCFPLLSLSKNPCGVFQQNRRLAELAAGLPV